MLNRQTFKRHLRPLYPLATDMAPHLAMLPPIKCILFDVYGTLLISASGDIGSPVAGQRRKAELEPLLQHYAISKTPQELADDLETAIASEHHRLKAKGIAFPEIRIEKIWQGVLEREDLDSVKAFALEYELMTNPVYPMPHMARLLRVCRQCQVSMGIMSNAQFYTPLLFEYFCHADLVTLGFHPDLIFFSYQFGMAKPSPQLFAAAVDRLQNCDIDPGETLFLGNDMLNDILPAEECGLLTALFAGDRRSLRLREDHLRCRNLKPLLQLTHLKQLAALLERQHSPH